ncbi:DUF3515 domain-containing protein [Streptomyces kasugaensis]|uniref:DUF3515 domain-containing protein n=2 Tax=Streptomyces kasugaensis TaxID=1946 RepID=A0A4Q9HXX0_STRKA|nr:DUF3515 domain-containing protein [Streptomyces kasugaensis]
MISLSRKSRIAIGLMVSGAILAGGVIAFAIDSPSSVMESAPNASSPLCGEIAKKYPREILGEARSDVELPGVAVWGESTVILRCGLTPPRPTLDPCFNVNGVDWVLEEGKSGEGMKTLITYGRNPAVEVVISDASPSAGDGLVDLSKVVEGIPQKSKCL